MKFRIEKDSLGKKKIPKEAYFGIHTQRTIENFQISGRTLHLELFHAIAEIKEAVAKTNLDLKLLRKHEARAIIKAAQEAQKGKFDNQFLVDIFQAGAGTSTHMNVNEVIANRAIEILHGKKGDYTLIHPNDQVNLGQSTNDVFPTAVKISAVKGLFRLIETLETLEKSLLIKSKEFKKIIKSGRTHLQDAVPITLGQEFHAYTSLIKKDITRIKEAISFLLYLNIGMNAIGTGINTYLGFRKRIISNLKKINKLPWKEARDPIEATQSTTDFLEAADALKATSVDLIKIANDLRLLSSGPNTGLREINLPPIEPGSSIMPGKINPSMAEMLNMVCFQVIGYEEAIAVAAQAGQLELNVMLPLIAHNLLESINILNNATEVFSKKCIQGVKANKEVCQYYLEHSAGLATALSPYIGYDKATEIVKESLKTGIPISQVALKKRLMRKSDLDRILNYK
ncbi:MAG: aspartate ammonia-lyase, partial [Nanoarchaeota archaeon]